MSFSVTFEDFISDVTTNLGVNCGLFDYVIQIISLDPEDPAIITNLAVNAADKVIETSVKKSLTPNGLIATFSLTGTLQTYPTITHTE